MEDRITEDLLDKKSEPFSDRKLDDVESPLSKLSGWMDVQTPSEDNVPKLKWVEYFEKIKSHSNVCEIDLETDNIQHFNVDFFDESEKEFLRECVQKALTGKLTRGKFNVLATFD